MSVEGPRVETKSRIPVTLVTGFLGSGKTTLINAALRAPDLAKTVVVVNEFGEVEPNKEKLSLPYENLPWYIHMAKQPFDSIGATLSSRVRYNSLWWMNHNGAKNFANYIKQNPNLVPEVEKGIQYQYAKLFGSIEPLIHPKQAWEMLEYKAVSVSMPMQEQMKNYVTIKKFGYNPMEGEIKKYEGMNHAMITNSMDRVTEAAVKRKEIKYNFRGEIT